MSSEGYLSKDLCFLSPSLEPPFLPNLCFSVLACAVFKVRDKKQVMESWRSTVKDILLYKTCCLLWTPCEEFIWNGILEKILFLLKNCCESFVLRIKSTFLFSLNARKFIYKRQDFCCSVAQSCLTLATLLTTTCLASLPLTISQSLLKFMSIKSVMSSSHLILWCPLLLLPSVFPSIRDFSNESAVHIIWPKYWSFTYSIGPSNEYWGLIFLEIDWFDFLAVQGTLRSLLHHHNSKASILQHATFFMVQLSWLYMTTGKTIAMTIQTSVGRVMSLLFNTLSGLSSFSCQEAIFFWFHDCSHHLQWF